MAIHNYEVEGQRTPSFAFTSFSEEAASQGERLNIAATLRNGERLKPLSKSILFWYCFILLVKYAFPSLQTASETPGFLKRYPKFEIRYQHQACAATSLSSGSRTGSLTRTDELRGR